VVRDLVVDLAGCACNLASGVVHHVDCSDVMAHGRDSAGAEIDICHPDIAHLVSTAIAVLPPMHRDS